MQICFEKCNTKQVYYYYYFHMHTHTLHTAHSDNSLGQCSLPLFLPLNLCEVYPADSLCSAQKCVETHCWRQHFFALATPNSTHTHTLCIFAVYCLSVQLSLCLSVNICKPFHILHMFTLVFAGKGCVYSLSVNFTLS